MRGPCPRAYCAKACSSVREDGQLDRDPEESWPQTHRCELNRIREHRIRRDVAFLKSIDVQHHRVILQVLADAGEIDDGGDPERIHHGRVTDSGELQQLR